MFDDTLCDGTPFDGTPRHPDRAFGAGPRQRGTFNNASDRSFGGPPVRQPAPSRPLLADLAPADEGGLSLGLAAVAVLAGAIALTSGWFGAAPRAEAQAPAAPYQVSAIR